VLVGMRRAMKIFSVLLARKVVGRVRVNLGTVILDLDIRMHLWADPAWCNAQIVLLANTC